jgi:hypothetical protein
MKGGIDYKMEKTEVINKSEDADSIEWRLETGKSVKVYGDMSNPEEFKKRLENAIKILRDVDNE